MSEQIEKLNSSTQGTKGDLFVWFAFLSTAIWGFLCLFGLLYHWGLMAGLGIPEGFFPLSFQMLPVQAYLAFTMAFNKLAGSYDDTFMLFPAVVIGLTILISSYFFSTKWAGKCRERLCGMITRTKAHAGKRQVTDICASIFVACAIYLGPRAVLFVIGIIWVMPLTGYFIGKGIAVDSTLREARLCLKKPDKATAGCVEFTDSTGQAIRGYILAQSESFIAWYLNEKIEIRPLDKAMTYKVIMKPYGFDKKREPVK